MATATKLGELLLGAGLITPAQLDEALRSQMIFGGKLGTNLVELGYITSTALAKFLSAQLKIPCAEASELEEVPESVLKIVPGELADRHKVFPLGVKRQSLRLAMAMPTDLSVVDEVGFLTGMNICPVVAPEILIVYALEKHYGIQRPARYVRVGASADWSAEGASQVAAPVAPPMPAPQPVRPSIEVGEVARSLVEIRDPVEALDVLLRALEKEFAKVALFVVQGESTRGWAQSGCAVAGDFRGITFASRDSQLVRTAAAGRTLWSVPVCSPLDERLLAALGLRSGAEMLIGPVMVDQRIGALVLGGDARFLDPAASLSLCEQILLRTGFAVEMARLRGRILAPAMPAI